MEDDLERIGRAMMLAWGQVKKAQSRLWSQWIVIGEGLMEGRRWAMHVAGVNKPEGKGYVTAYAEWLRKYRVDDMDKGDRAKLLQLMEERPAVEEWRATLPDHERRNLNNPTSIWRKWTAATRVRKPKPRTAGVSATEHGRAQAIIDQQQGRIAELEEELAGARGSEGTATREHPAAERDGLDALRTLVTQMNATGIGQGWHQRLVEREVEFGFDAVDVIELTKWLKEFASAMKRHAKRAGTPPR